MSKYRVIGHDKSGFVVKDYDTLRVAARATTAHQPPGKPDPCRRRCGRRADDLFGAAGGVPLDHRNDAAGRRQAVRRVSVHERRPGGVRRQRLITAGSYAQG